VATEDRDSAEAGAENAATEIDEAGAERIVGGRRILIATR